MLLGFFFTNPKYINIFKSLILPTIPVIILFYFCSVTNYNLALKRNPIHISIFHFLIQCVNTSDTPFPQKTATSSNVNHPDTQKDTITYIPISNDALSFCPNISFSIRFE